jgi:steroid delta-isomerase-like uncharacterized protein
MTKEELVGLIMRHVDAENRHDMAGTLATLHPGCEFVDHGMGETFLGHEGAQKHYEMWWRGFDLRVAGERRYMDGSSFIAECRFQGLHHGEFMGVAASGRSIDLRVAVFVDVRDGLMASERFYYDMTELLAQMRGAKS